MHLQSTVSFMLNPKAKINQFNESRYKRTHAAFCTRLTIFALKPINSVSLTGFPHFTAVLFHYSLLEHTAPPNNNARTYGYKWEV